MTAPEPPDQNGRDRSVAMLVCTTVLALAVLGAYVWQQSTGHENGTLLVLLAGLIGAGGFGYASHARTGQVQRDVTAVRQQTNGNTSRLLDIVAEQQRLLAQAGPIPPQAPGVDTPPEVPAAAPAPPTP